MTQGALHEVRLQGGDQALQRGTQLPHDHPRLLVADPGRGGGGNKQVDSDVMKPLDVSSILYRLFKMCVCEEMYVTPPYML